MSELHAKLHIKPVLAADLPASEELGRLLFTTDTEQLYIGKGAGNPLAHITAGSGGTVDWDDITGKPSTFPPTVPIAESNVTNLVSDLATKAATTYVDSHDASTLAAAQAYTDARVTERHVRVNLTPTQFKSLASTPFQLVPAPGVGFVIVPTKARLLVNGTGNHSYNSNPSESDLLLELKWGTNRFSTFSPSTIASCSINAISFSSGGAPVDAFEHFLLTGSGSIEIATAITTQLENQPLMLTHNGSDFTFGYILTAQVSPGNNGTGYTVGDNIAIGPHQGAYIQVTSVDGNGGVLTFDPWDEFGDGTTLAGYGYRVQAYETTAVDYSGSPDDALKIDVLSVQQGDAPVSLEVWYLIESVT
jgi:hypothetical protein